MLHQFTQPNGRYVLIDTEAVVSVKSIGKLPCTSFKTHACWFFDVADIQIGNNIIQVIDSEDGLVAAAIEDHRGFDPDLDEIIKEQRKYRESAQ